MTEREKYIKAYKKIGKNMFSKCYIPNVGDFSKIINKNNKTAMEKLKTIGDFNDMTDDIIKSLKKTTNSYTEEESFDFIKTVIAANVTDITQSGYFYKKLISSCDNLEIDNMDDCGSEGEELSLPIDEDTFKYKVKNHFITELNKIITSYTDFTNLTKKMKSVHVRNFLTCSHDPNHRHFCKKCAGLYKREAESSFIPKHIGIYSTLMITEHATQASLDSMNKGTNKSLNVLLEQNIKVKTYDDIKREINRIIEEIGYIGVESRFYEIALLSRMYEKEGVWDCKSLQHSFINQGDILGSLIYKPEEKIFNKFLSSDNINATSNKSKIAFDIYD